MTPADFCKQLQTYENDTSIKLPMPIKVGPSDAMAGKLLLWLFEQMPDEVTQGDIEAVLDSAKWWVVFWASAFEAKKWQAVCKMQGYKFAIGQKVKLTGLIDRPEHNGKIITIEGYRPVTPNEYCPSGKAYYTDFREAGDYYYEERMEEI